MLNRRLFVAGTASGALAPLAGKSDASPIPDDAWPIAIFEKVFEGLSYEELASAIEEIGADGVEATIRPGGHIEPEQAAQEVPLMQQAMKERGKRIVIAATHIRSIEDPQTIPLLETLKANDITHYRMGHYYLDLNKPVLPQVRQYAVQAQQLAAFNKEFGLQGLYQNHSGGGKRAYLGALGWDAALMLEGIDPDSLGLAFDTRHLRKDTGSSWRVAVAACKPHIRSIYVKDGMWHGQRSDQYKDVPLDTGFVNKEIFSTMREGLNPMPLCIHMEWLGYRIFKKQEIPQAIDAHRRDIAALRRWLS